MCGRFAFFSAHDAMPALFGLAAEMPGVVANYNIAPTDLAAVIRRSTDNATNELCMLRWGLVPFWAKDVAIGNRLINARAETVHEKPAFRAAYKRRRCLVPADGYYEWHKSATGKQPYFVTRADDAPFAMAGLWESWTDKDSGDDVETFTLLTREPNESLARLHHRMPVIVSSADADAWLEGSIQALGGTSPAVPAADAFGFRAVSKRVNNPRNKTEDVLEPPTNLADDPLNTD
ncbi:MAG: SOS response-associated peptidase [Pseudomonadota bacterium]